MKKIFIIIFLLISITGYTQSITEVYYPKYVQGVGTNNPPEDRKVPYACRMQINGLTPNATYRYYSLFGNAPTGISGSGFYIIANQSGNFSRVTSPTLAVAGRYGQFTTNASGSATEWFVIEPSSAIDFAPGNTLYWRVFLNNGSGGTSVVTRITAPNPVTVLGWGSAATQGTGLRNTNVANYTAKNFVMLYDNIAGTGRPESGTFVESDGTRNLSALNADPTNEGYAPFYGDFVDGVNGAWGTIIPNNLANGIGNISQYSLSDGSIVNSCTSANGSYGSTNTALASAGLAALTLTCTPAAPALSVSGTVTNVNCFGQSTGAINASVNGGTAPYSYSWSNAANTEDISGLAAGSYTLTVTDAASATAQQTFTVTEPVSALSASSSAGSILCNGGSTTVTVTASGGTAPYTGTGTFTVTAGSYSFTVTDSKGCSSIASGTVTQPTSVSASATNTAILCNGGSATVTVTATGGTGPYTGTGTFTQPAGTVVYTVTDTNGCTGTVSHTVSQPTQLTASVTNGTLSCAGTTTIVVSATGGTAPYSNVGTKTITQAGSYTYTVTDANGCQSVVTATVSPASGCPSVTEVLYPKYVQGVGSGTPEDDRKVPYAARMTVSGLTPNTTYRYYSRFVDNPLDGSNGNGGYILANQSGNFTRVTSPSLAVSGRYAELTTNASGSATEWFIIEPSSSSDFAPGNQLYWRLFLNNGAGGTSVSYRVTASSPVTVLGFGSASNQGTAIRSAANPAYTAKNFIMLYNNEAGTGRPESGTFIEDDGTANGSALNGDPFTAGYAPFYGDNVDGVDKAWGSIIPNNLSTGIRNITQYTLANGAFVNRCVTSDGVYGAAVTANTTGGLTPQVVTCTPFAAATVADPAVGQMSFTTLANASQSANSLLFTQDYKLRLPVYNLNQTNIIPNGTIRLTVDLGTRLNLAAGFNLAAAPLNNYFAWTSQITGGHEIITGTQIADIPADFVSTAVFEVRGILSCTSTIASNITITNTLAILTDEDLQNNASSLQYTLPVTVTTTQVNVTCNGAANGVINAVASPGATVVIRNSSNQVVANTNLAPGTYTVTASATGDNPPGNTCTASTQVTIVQPLVLTLAVSSTTNNNCNSGNAGSVTVIPAGGTAPYSFVISGPTVNTTGAGSGIFTGLTAGVYIVTSTDANGCTANTTATITQPAGTAPDISLGSDITGSLFAAPGSSQTIVYNVAEIAGNPAIGDTIRITKVEGFTINFNVAIFSTVVGGTTYTLDNSRWKIDNSDPSFVSIILTDPSNISNPGTILCNQLLNVAVTITRNTADISTFTLSARLRKANGEVNLSNNLNSVVLTAE